MSNEVGDTGSDVTDASLINEGVTLGETVEDDYDDPDCTTTVEEIAEGSACPLPEGVDKVSDLKYSNIYVFCGDGAPGEGEGEFLRHPPRIVISGWDNTAATVEFAYEHNLRFKASLETLAKHLLGHGDEREFFLSSIGSENTGFRVARIDSQAGRWYALRRSLISITSLEELGVPDHLVECLDYVSVRRGLILVVGSMGAGKTTFASAVMHRFLTKIGGVGVTIEDPPELPLEGPVGNAGMCFQLRCRLPKTDDRVYEGGPLLPTAFEAFVSSLRMAPRFLMLGEIRENESASQIIRAGGIGNVVIGTLHAEDVLSGISNLEKMAVQNDSEDMVRAHMATGLALVVHCDQVQTRERAVVRYKYLFTTGQTDIAELIRAGKVKLLVGNLERQEKMIEAGKKVSHLAKGRGGTKRVSRLVGDREKSAAIGDRTPPKQGSFE